MMFDKSLILPSPPFYCKKSSIGSLLCQHANVALAPSLPLFFQLKLLPQLECPFPLKLLTKVPLFPLPRSSQGIISPFSHRCCLDVLACPPRCFVSFPSGPFLLPCSWGTGPFPYWYPHPLPRALVAWHSAILTAFNCSDNVGSHQRSGESWLEQVAFFLMDVKWPRNLAWHPDWPLLLKPWHVCSLPLSSSSGTLLTILEDSAQIALEERESTLTHRTRASIICSPRSPCFFFKSLVTVCNYLLAIVYIPTQLQAPGGQGA